MCIRDSATGLFAMAEIQPTSNNKYISIPIDAVIEGNNKEAYVYTVKDNKAYKQPVKVAFIKAGEVMLTDGLEPDAQVVTDGSAYLTDGAKVNIVK